MIRRRDAKDDLLVKRYLSLFSLSKVITLATKVSKAIPKTIGYGAIDCKREGSRTIGIRTSVYGT